MSETRTENVTLECGCLLTSAGLEWCPLHKAAGALLEALEAYQRCWAEPPPHGAYAIMEEAAKAAYLQARAAIAEARPDAS